MKANRILLAAIVIVAVVMPLRAQGQMEACLKRMIDDPKVTVSTSIQLDSKPVGDVQQKTSVCEVNRFVITKPNKKHRYAETGLKYVTDLVAEIQAEGKNPQCYRIASYNVGAGQPRQWQLLYGEDASQYLLIGDNPVKNYIFACVADEQQPGYRWCYALEWWQMGKETVQGRYIRVYAKMPDTKVSESVSYSGTLTPRPLTSLANDSLWYVDVNKVRSEMTLRSFNALRARWAKGDYKTDAALPVAVYTLVKDAVEANILDEDEKEVIRLQLIELGHKTDITTSEGDAAVQYLSLAMKVLNR